MTLIPRPARHLLQRLVGAYRGSAPTELKAGGPAFVHNILVSLDCTPHASPAATFLPGRSARFVVRCAVSAVAAYAAAGRLGLPQPVWAPVSALIVAQDSLAASITLLKGRLIGTLLGAGAAMIAHQAGVWSNIPISAQLAMAVAIVAPFAVEKPSIRVCLWTTAIILIGEGTTTVPQTAFLRSCEVCLGAAAALGIQVVDESLAARVARRRECASAEAVPAGRQNE